MGLEWRVFFAKILYDLFGRGLLIIFPVFFCSWMRIIIYHYLHKHYEKPTEVPRIKQNVWWWQIRGLHYLGDIFNYVSSLSLVKFNTTQIIIPMGYWSIFLKKMPKILFQKRDCTQLITPLKNHYTEWEDSESLCTGKEKNDHHLSRRIT